MTQKERHALNAAKRRAEQDPIVEHIAQEYLAQMAATKTMIVSILEDVEKELEVKLRRTKSGRFAVDSSGAVIIEEGDSDKFWELANERQNQMFEDYPLTKLGTPELINLLMEQYNCPSYRFRDVGQKISDMFHSIHPSEDSKDMRTAMNPFEVDRTYEIQNMNAQLDETLAQIDEQFGNTKETE